MRAFQIIAKRIAAIQKTTPILLCIDGIDGSGKTFFARKLAAAVAQTGKNVVLCAVDDFHNPQKIRYQKGQFSPLGFYEDSYNYRRLIADLLLPFATGRGSYIAALFDVDRDLSLATKRQPVPENAVLIVEGILVLAEESVRERLDLRIFIDTDADLRLARRLQRDIDERGRTISLVLKQYMETVRPMYLEYVDPSKRHADLIIPGGFNPQAVALVRALIASRMQPQSL